jgi:hypothetical protein
MVITKRDKKKKISDHLGNEYEKVNTFQCTLSQESQNALFRTSNGLVGMLSLMQSTQVPKSVNYRLLFSVWRYISISKVITRAFFISQRLYFTPTSECRNKQMILFQKLGCRSILNRL